MNEHAEFRALSVRFPEDLHALLRDSAAAHERSWGGEVRAIVREHLEAQKSLTEAAGP
jgi:plasmid stability protein